MQRRKVLQRKPKYKLYRFFPVPSAEVIFWNKAINEIIMYQVVKRFARKRKINFQCLKFNRITCLVFFCAKANSSDFCSKLCATIIKFY
jgi:hypothetical protein